MTQKSSYELDERAANARALLNNPMLIEAFDALKDRYTLGFQNAELGSPQALANHSKLKVIEEIKRELESVISDQKISQKRVVKYG